MLLDADASLGVCDATESTVIQPTFLHAPGEVGGGGAGRARNTEEGGGCIATMQMGSDVSFAERLPLRVKKIMREIALAIYIELVSTRTFSA